MQSLKKKVLGSPVKPVQKNLGIVRNVGALGDFPNPAKFKLGDGVVISWPHRVHTGTVVNVHRVSGDRYLYDVLMGDFELIGREYHNAIASQVSEEYLSHVDIPIPKFWLGAVVRTIDPSLRGYVVGMTYLVESNRWNYSLDLQYPDGVYRVSAFEDQLRGS